MPNWSREQFTVASTVPDGDKRGRNSRSVVTLKDESGEELRGKWYPGGDSTDSRQRLRGRAGT